METKPCNKVRFKNKGKHPQSGPFKPHHEEKECKSKKNNQAHLLESDIVILMMSDVNLNR